VQHFRKEDFGLSCRLGEVIVVESGAAIADQFFSCAGAAYLDHVLLSTVRTANDEGLVSDSLLQAVHFVAPARCS